MSNDDQELKIIERLRQTMDVERKKRDAEWERGARKRHILAVFIITIILFLFLLIFLAKEAQSLHPQEELESQWVVTGN